MFAWSYYRRVKPTARAYLHMLDRIHQALLPRSYVEIGVSTGQSLALALPGTVCAGVDPAPNVKWPLPTAATIYAQTSDDFFERGEVEFALHGFPLDLAFIDGMHKFEFALRDFINLERAGSSDTTILVHDCLPPNEASATRERQTSQWAGDVWKLIACLRERRPDLEVAVLDVGPTGLGVIRRLDPASGWLHDHYDEVLEQYLPLPFSRFEQADKAELLGVVPCDWGTASSLLPRRPLRAEDVTVLKAGRLVRSVRWELRRVARRQARRAVHRIDRVGH